jgi:monoamine oxidase
LRHTAGAQSLTDALAAAMPPGALRRAVPVSAIEVDADRLQVVVEGAVLGAAHVVLAIPPALAVSQISFEPALPGQLARLAASCPVWMGAVSKIVVQYPEAFWRAAGLAGAAQSMLGPLREIHDMSGPGGHPAALFGFAATARADPRLSEERATEQVVGQLVRLFGPQAAAPDRVILRDWGVAPYTSPPEVERRTDYALFGHRLFAEPAFQGRLHWASAETSERSPGHVEGALAAAERAAAKVIGALAQGR